MADSENIELKTNKPKGKPKSPTRKSSKVQVAPAPDAAIVEVGGDGATIDIEIRNSTSQAGDGAVLAEVREMKSMVRAMTKKNAQLERKIQNEADEDESFWKCGWCMLALFFVIFGAGFFITYGMIGIFFGLSVASIVAAIPNLIGLCMRKKGQCHMIKCGLHFTFLLIGVVPSLVLMGTATNRCMSQEWWVQKIAVNTDGKIDLSLRITGMLNFDWSMFTTVKTRYEVYYVPKDGSAHELIAKRATLPNGDANSVDLGPMDVFSTRLDLSKATPNMYMNTATKAYKDGNWFLFSQTDESSPVTKYRTDCDACTGGQNKCDASFCLVAITEYSSGGPDGAEVVKSDCEPFLAKCHANGGGCDQNDHVENPPNGDQAGTSCYISFALEDYGQDTPGLRWGDTGYKVRVIANKAAFVEECPNVFGLGYNGDGHKSLTPAPCGGGLGYSPPYEGVPQHCVPSLAYFGEMVDEQYD